MLIFLLQAASTSFTPMFQAAIPYLLRDEKDYTRALSLSRLAYDLESLLSPLLAAALLSVIAFHWLFAGTAIGFTVSALLIATVTLPGAVALAGQQGLYGRTTRGIRIYFATPRLRGLLALNLAAAAAGAMVVVNSVVYVAGGLGRGSADVAMALAPFGGGSIVAALALPRLFDRVAEHRIMFAAAGLIAAALFFMAAAAFGNAASWPLLLIVWWVLGLGYSTLVTPAGRLLRRSSQQVDRPALFAAHFALSHACWLLTYPLAGWLGASAGMPAVLLALVIVAALGGGAAVLLWPWRDPERLGHRHDDLPAHHPHLSGAAQGAGGASHSHAFVIDDHHRRWPERG